MPPGLRDNGGHFRRPHVLLPENKAWERHLGIQSYLSRCLQSSAIPHRREQSASGDLKRDADILIPSWEAGRGLAIDVGIAHPYPPGQDHTTVSAAATILSNRCLRKDIKYSERCTASGFSFRPLVQSIWGAFALGMGIYALRKFT
jgi:hypothetical protein